MLILLNKPYGVLCQFTDAGGRPTLAGLVAVPHVYPAGRLDLDSEGLLLLTDDGALQARLADPRRHVEKVYRVQVEGVPGEEALARLRAGLVLKDGPTRPARARLIEGRNRQVRRMTAAVGLPALRLIRVSVGPYELGALRPGQWREVEVSSAR